MKRTTHLLLSGMAGTATLIAAAPAQAEGVAAGTPISNTAQATYTIGGETETIPSNTVTVKVSEILDVTVSSLDGGNVALTADGSVLSYQVNNTGNGPEAYEITVDPAIAGDDFDPLVTQIAYDSNGNGVYDDGVDTVIPAGGSTPEIAADNSLLVFLITEFDNPTPGDGETADVRLTAIAETGSDTPGTVFAGQGVDGADAVVGTTTAQDNAIGTLIAQLSVVMLSKSATVLDPFGGTSPVPGAVVTYQLVASVTGSAAISDLVVSDAIPVNTTYFEDSLTLEGGLLTDEPGDDAGEADGTDITVDLGELPGGSTRTITFQVTIED